MDEEDDMRTLWSEEQLDRALHELRADVTTGEPAAVRARAQLMRAAGVDQEGEPTMVMEDVARRFDRAATRERRRRPGRWLAAAAAVGVVVAGALVVQAIPGGGATAQAAEVLDRSADAAAAGSDPVVGPGQYLYLETHSWYSTTTVFSDRESLSYLREEVFQEWIPADRDDEWQQVRTSTGNRIWTDGSDEEAAAAGVELDQPGTEVYTAPRGEYFGPTEPGGSWQQPTPEFLASLPRDPDALYRRLGTDAPDNSRGDMELLVYAADALRSGQVPADLRAALYQALTRLPGLAVTEEAANLDGRTGTALGMTDPSGYREEIIVDPVSGAFIGERDVDPDGVVQGFTAVSYDVADEIGVQPTG